MIELKLIEVTKGCPWNTIRYMYVQIRLDNLSFLIQGLTYPIAQRPAPSEIAIRASGFFSSLSPDCM